MLYYVTLGTNALPRARAFYGPTLATLGIVDLRPDADEACYGHPGDADPRLYIVSPYDRMPATRVRPACAIRQTSIPAMCATLTATSCRPFATCQSRASPLKAQNYARQAPARSRGIAGLRTSA